MADELATVEVAPVPGAVVARIAGEVDLSTAPALRDRLVEAVSGQPFVLDLTGVTYLDSSGLRLVDELSQAVARAGGRLSVVSPPASLSRTPLHVAGLDQVVPVHATLAEALAAVRSGRPPAHPGQFTE